MGLYSDVIFPRFFDCFVRHKGFDEKRAGLLAQVRGKTLEVGAGTGLNLDRYPDFVDEITVVEPNPGMKAEFLKKAKKQRIKTNFHLCGAEKMPFADEEFDTVVSTLTICSIPKLPEALKEISRVLKNNGQFIFLEHGLSDNKFVARTQKFINPLQKVCGAGCQITINVEQEIKAAGFNIIEIKKYQLEDTPRFIGAVYEGIATKAQGRL